MPIPIQFNDDDVKQRMVVTPDWYRVKVTKVTDKPAKAPSTSTNYWLEGEIICNSDTGDTKYAGVPTPFLWLFNSGAMGFAYGFIAAISGESPEIGKRYDLQAAEGKELDVFIENEIWNGQMQNKINHKYRPVRPVKE